MLDFKDATLEIFLRSALPMGDMLTGGKLSGGVDAIGDRAAAGEIAFTEVAELFGAIKDAARSGLDYYKIKAIFDEAADVKAALTLLADPSKTVILDGVATTADDDDPPKSEAEADIIDPSDIDPPGTGGGEVE